MKQILILFIVLLEFNLYSQDFSVGLSTRPSIDYSNSQSIYPTKNGLYKDYYNKKVNSIRLSLDLEIPQKHFFHTTSIRYYFKKINIDREIKNTDTLYLKYTMNGFANEYTLLYGIGKYFPIYKKSLYIVLSNSIFAKIKKAHIENSDATSFDDKNIKLLNKKIFKDAPYINEIGYEIKPTILYKYKIVSVYLSFPIYLYNRFSDGIKKTTYVTTDYSTGITDTDISEFETKFSEVRLTYNIEIGMKFHFKLKKKK